MIILTTINYLYTINLTYNTYSWTLFCLIFTN